MDTKRIIIGICAALVIITTGVAYGTASRGADLPWRSFFPIGYDELDLAAQLLEENCFEPRFIVPHTSAVSKSDKTERTTIEFIIVGKRIEACTPGDAAWGEIPFD